MRLPPVINTLIGAAAIAAVQIALPADVVASDPHVQSSDVRWKTPPTKYLGAGFAKAFRYKTLIGGGGAPVRGKNVLFGEAEFAPGAIYVGHRHPAPEIYYIISGEAEWTVGKKTFLAKPGMAIYTPPNTVHRMVNVGDGVLKTIWMWWGTAKKLGQFPEITEPKAEQPARAKFPD